jgi:predicted RNA-binding Zn-ribbon protein involved in translation (DUF1610 family)
MKKLSELICPTCGRNEPVFISDCCRMIAYPLNDNDYIYDLKLDIDYDDIVADMKDSISEGTAVCRCSHCGTEIIYFKEDE